MKTPFDTIVSEVMQDANAEWMLSESLDAMKRAEVDRAEKIPLRYRIIALGFMRQYSPEELSEKLRENGLPGLYARSLWEASLIYAFMHQLSYHEWQGLRDICEAFRKERTVEDRYFKKASISMQELRSYITENSAESASAYATGQLTRLVERELLATKQGEEAFRAFLSNNTEAFSPVREKTRYYFCKYLYYMLTTRIDRYAEALASGIGTEETFADLVVFKGITPLKRKKHTAEEAKAFLSEIDLSCGEIFDAFNYYFFNYVSMDWMQVLLEYYGNVEHLPINARKELAISLRRYNQELYGGLKDEEVIDKCKQIMEDDEDALDHIYSLSGEGRGYQKNRIGENTIRKYIKGVLDIDRTTLVCFLLFFGSNTSLPAGDEISEERLTDILLECGFAGLRKDDAFDYFVMRYLSAEDPVDFLMQEATNYAMEEENFFLYRVYQGSTHFAKPFETA